MIYTCNNCKNTFKDYPSQRRNWKYNYCCMKCRREHEKVLVLNVIIPEKTMSLCLECKTIKPVGEFPKNPRRRANGCISYYCKECTNSKRRDYYDKNLEMYALLAKQSKARNGYTKSNTEYKPAHRKVRTALKNGSLVKSKSCQECNKVGYLHAHHHNGYDNPLDVIWLCPSCHAGRHGRGPKARIKNGYSTVKV